MAEQSDIIGLFLALIIGLVLLRSFLPSRRGRRDTASGRPAKARPSATRRDKAKDGPSDGRLHRAAGALPNIAVNPRSILVDGSNVMHWDANTPSSPTLMRVLAALRKHGNDPILCFDANVGYKLFGTHLNPEDLARLFSVAPAQVLVTQSGTDADAMILRLAVAHGLPVVSRDRFVDYPDLAGRVERMTGTIDEGVVTLKLEKRSPRTETQDRPLA
jgi:hypothetical protein